MYVRCSGELACICNACVVGGDAIQAISGPQATTLSVRKRLSALIDADIHKDCKSYVAARQTASCHPAATNSYKASACRRPVDLHITVRYN